MMRRIYVCSPYGGKPENYELAKFYCKCVVEQGHIPIAPHVMLHGLLDDRNPAHRTAALGLGLNMLLLVDEVWVYGDPTPGMQGEINEAKRLNIKIKFMGGNCNGKLN